MAAVLVALGFGLLACLALQGWALLHLRAQGVRVGERLDALTRPPKPRTAATPAPTPTKAPDFALPSLAGVPRSLSDLLKPAKPLLLYFTDPRCGPCYELLPDLGGWQRHYADRLSIAVVSAGRPAHNWAMTAEYGIQTVLLQEEREIADAFGVRMAPAAVVVDPNGVLRGEVVYGTPLIRELVATTLGLALPPAPVREIQPAGLGERVTAPPRPDLTGNVVDLAAPGEPTLVLFWGPGCQHCQELLPEIKAWEMDAGLPTMIVVSRGPAALNVAAGLRSPIVLDDDRTIAGSFGATGTPAAVLIDARGVVASPVARGTSGVRALVAELAPVAVAAD